MANVDLARWQFAFATINHGNQDETPAKIIAIPHLLSLLATNHWNGKVIGLNPLQAQYSKSSTRSGRCRMSTRSG